VAASRSDELRLALTDTLLPISPGLVYDPVSSGADPAPLEIELRQIETALRESDRVALRRDIGPIDRPRPRDLVRGLQRGSIAARYGPRFLLTRIAPLSVPEVEAMLHRARALQRDAEIAIHRVERNRRFRDVPMVGHATLYQQIDAPRLVRLRDIRTRAGRMAIRLEETVHHAQPAGAERRIAPGRATRDVTARLSAARTLPELYERWLMLQIVKTIALSGFRGGTVHDALAATGSEYLADFDSDAPVRFDAGPGRSLAVYFEPWVHPRDVAVASRAALYRPGAGLHSWRPDLIVQVESTTMAGHMPVVSAAIVIDAKATAVVGLEHWHQVDKYRDIRACHSDERVVHYVCIATPGRLAAAPAELVHGSGIVPELLRLSPLAEDAAVTHAELERVLGLMEPLLRVST
jgi:hypothetical protein